MASVGQVIAARGVMHPPWLVQRPRPRSDRSAARRVITRGVADQVARMMRAVVSYGTGVQAQSAITTVNGKTGTAEVGPGKSDAWFVGYAPAEGSAGGRLGAARPRRGWRRGGRPAGPADDRRLAAMSDGPRGIVLDMEGVLHVDWRPIDGSPEAVTPCAGGASSSPS